jgi:uncharacterized membrane protein
MSNCLIAEYETEAAAKAGLEVLESEHFTLENVSVVSSASDDARKHLDALHDESARDASVSPSAPEGRGVSLGMLIGGTVVAGTLVGPFVIAGPLLGMALGAAIGGLLSHMHRWGVPHHVSSDYEQRVQSGSVLVIVHDIDDVRLAGAERLLNATNPKTIEKYAAS